MFKVNIPYLCPPYVAPEDHSISVPLPQPIMEFKDQQVDTVRYEAWKARVKRRTRVEPRSAGQ
jgi:hypothetical protein